MNPRLLLRSAVVGAIVFAGGLAILVLAAGDGPGDPGGGIRIDTVSGAEAATAGDSAPIRPGAPNFHRVLGPRFHGYESVTLPVGDGRQESFRFLAFHLACERAFPEEERAENVIFSLFPRPATAREARRRAREEAEPSVVITAARAEGRNLLRPGATGAPRVLTLTGGVRVRSLEGGRRAELDAEELLCHADERRVESSGAVRLRSQAYVVEGTGLSGDIALGTFSVNENVSVTLPTATLLGPKAEAGSVTRIRSSGPLFVERLSGEADAAGRVPVRVTLTDHVHVSQESEAGDVDTTLDAREVTILLRVPRGGPDARSASPVDAERLEARGGVTLVRGEETHATSESLVVERRPTGERVVLEGPARLEHRGELPGAGESGPAPGVLTVDASRNIEILRDETEETFRAVFTGHVEAVRTTPEEKPILTLTCEDRLSLASDPRLGQELVASGGATFAAPTADGHADRITWTTDRDGIVVTRLDGSPFVIAEAAKGPSPLSLAPEPTAPNPAGGEGPEATFVLEAEKSIVLTEEGESRTFVLRGRPTIRRFLGEEEQLVVRADRIEAQSGNGEMHALRAEGSVDARGAGGVAGVGAIRARGDTFTWSPGNEGAVLEGSPARITISETTERADRISAHRIELRSENAPVVATGEVHATVHLERTETGAGRPVDLFCDRLEVDPRPETAGGEGAAGPAGRIESLTATGAVELTVEGWVGRGSRLEYHSTPGEKIVLIGGPAVLTRPRIIAGTRFVDRFEAPRFVLSLVDRRIVGFDSPEGGSFVLHRPYDESVPNVLGPQGDVPAAKTVERFSARATESLSFDESKGLARLSRDAEVRQYAGTPDDLALVASFTADVLEAWFKKAEDGDLVFRRAEGRGAAGGEGDGWKVEADGFSIDFTHHQTQFWGTPARVAVEGETFTVLRAVYDYENDEWPQLLGAESGGR